MTIVQVERFIDIESSRCSYLSVRLTNLWLEGW